MSDESAETADAWPDCEGEQVEVMLLGTYHMDNPGLDEINVDADDVLAPDRQAELETLTDRLAEWNPERIAVEWPYDWQAGVDALYEEYRTGARSFGEREAIDADFRFDSEADLGCRDETVQVGFRLADALDHERVSPIDHPMDAANDDLHTLKESDFEPERKADYSLPDTDRYEREVDERLADSTILEFLRWTNEEEQLRVNHDWMFARGVRWGEADNFGGPSWLASWYDRNLRMVHNLWRAIESGAERVLLLVGSGHVRALRHLLTEAPMFCPVSPLPYLRG
jgi:hypothetical protein